ncbi:MAG: hypothetical protein GXO24_04835 [Chlorobi bacterium]|nr:hypothetical protein [Chlorobiota bacterium]
MKTRFLFFLIILVSLAVILYAFAAGYRLTALAGIVLLLSWTGLAYKEKSLYAVYLNLMAAGMVAMVFYGIFTRNYILAVAAAPSMYLITLLKDIRSSVRN